MLSVDDLGTVSKESETHVKNPNKIASAISSQTSSYFSNSFLALKARCCAVWKAARMEQMAETTPKKPSMAMSRRTSRESHGRRHWRAKRNNSQEKMMDACVLLVSRVPEHA